MKLPETEWRRKLRYLFTFPTSAIHLEPNHSNMWTRVSFYFLMHTIFKVFIEFVTISLLFYALDFWPQGMWDLISPTRDQTCIPCIGTQSLNHSTMGKFPRFFLYAYNKIFVILWLFNYLTTNHFSYFS